MLLRYAIRVIFTPPPPEVPLTRNRSEESAWAVRHQLQREPHVASPEHGSARILDSGFEAGDRGLRFTLIITAPSAEAAWHGTDLHCQRLLKLDILNGWAYTLAPARPADLTTEFTVITLEPEDGSEPAFVVDSFVGRHFSQHRAERVGGFVRRNFTVAAATLEQAESLALNQLDAGVD